MNYEYKELTKTIVQIRDPQGVCITLIKGKNKSIVVDTGYGILKIKDYIEKLLSTPYIIICTHGHMDHTSGVVGYKDFYLHSKDIELFKEHNSRTRRMQNIEAALNLNIIDNTFDIEEYLNRKIPNILELNYDDVFDLGDKTVRIINMEGHTKGSIGLLIEEDRILLTGDAAIHNVWMFLRESTNIPTYINMLKRIKNLNFDYFITGHLMDMFPKRFIDYYIDVATKANSSNSEKTTFTNFELPNTYKYSEQFENINIGICFQEPKEE